MIENPWQNISLADYESHMSLDTVRQLQTMAEMMAQQCQACPAETLMILGIAGGNGLVHIRPRQFSAIYGVDVNRDYLAQCQQRYPLLTEFQPLLADLREKAAPLPHAGLLIANLLIEYIGCDAFLQVLAKVAPAYVSCGIQVDGAESFVSDSPYQHIFDSLNPIHQQIPDSELNQAMQDAGYQPMLRQEWPLPNGKMLLRLDFQKRR